MTSREYHFEVYQRRRGRTRQPARVIHPRVTFGSQKQICINRPAYYLLGKPEAVILMFDRERGTVGIKASDKSVDYARRVSKHRQAEYYTVSGMAFFTYFGIKYGERRSFTPTLEDGVLVCELNDSPTA